MVEMLKIGMASAIVAAATAVSVEAQEMAAGEYEYRVACAICHGESGMGAGPFAEMLNMEVPDLTALAAQNDGEFPYLAVFKTVDGRGGIRAHGSPMPIWGDRYSTEAQADFGIYGAEVVTRGRVAVLVDYIESIQK